MRKMKFLLSGPTCLSTVRLRKTRIPRRAQLYDRICSCQECSVEMCRGCVEMCLWCMRRRSLLEFLQYGELHLECLLLPILCRIHKHRRCILLQERHSSKMYTDYLQIMQR